jgi:hypothetical protein
LINKEVYRSAKNRLLQKEKERMKNDEFNEELRKKHLLSDEDK